MLTNEDRALRRLKRESRDVLTSLVESEKNSIDRFNSNLTSSSTSSIRTKNTFLQVQDDLERMHSDKIKAGRSNSLPSILSVDESVDLAAFLLSQLQITTPVVTSVFATNLVRDQPQLTIGRVFQYIYDRGYDISRITNVEIEDHGRLHVSFTNHQDLLAFRRNFEYTFAKDGINFSLISTESEPESLAPSVHLIDTPIVAPSRLFAGGLSPETTDASLFHHFSPYGDLVESSVILDKRTKLSRGFGFIAFKNGHVPPTVLSDTHIVDGKEIGVRIYTSSAQHK